MAGSIWVDGDLFSGKPNLEKLLAEPYKLLEPEEQAFLDQQVEQVCRMADDQSTYQQGDLNEEIWNFEKIRNLLCDSRFLGSGSQSMFFSIVIKFGQGREILLHLLQNFLS